AHVAGLLGIRGAALPRATLTRAHDVLPDQAAADEEDRRCSDAGEGATGAARAAGASCLLDDPAPVQLVSRQLGDALALVAEEVLDGAVLGQLVVVGCGIASHPSPSNSCASRRLASNRSRLTVPGARSICFAIVATGRSAK